MNQQTYTLVIPQPISLFQQAIQSARFGILLGAFLCTTLPLFGQITWQVNTGINNPIDTIKGEFYTFVDIDGDNDYDVVSGGLIPTPLGFENYYYENVGTASTPAFIERTKLFNVTNLLLPEFVDIDGDGDLDAFASMPDLLSGTETITFFKNIGTASQANLVPQAASDNPLQLLNGNQTDIAFAGISFADIDGDGDLDAFYNENTGSPNGVQALLFYRNIGTATAPIFQNDNAANPLPATLVGTSLGNFGAPQFQDVDGDGDLDAYFSQNAFYRNTGSPTSPMFATANGSTDPFANVPNSSTYDFPKWLDVDFDGDLDLFFTDADPNVGLTHYFLEQTTLTHLETFDNQSVALQLFPNPSKGRLWTQQPLSGTVSIYNLLGSTIKTFTITEVQEISLEGLDNGIYLLQLNTGNQTFSQKITIAQ